MGSSTVAREPGSPAPRRPATERGVQVFARDTRLPDTADLIYLERGHANLVRDDVNAGHLICPIPGCDDPRFIVRGGSKRDHFAHKPGASGHAPETVEHHNAKHLIARWLRHHHPQATIHVDDQTISSGQRPDVLIELDTTHHVGYEIQRAPLTADEWEARHTRYATSGVKDVWVFTGHTYAPSSSLETPTYRRLHPALEAVLSYGHPVIYLDPHSEVVALAVGPDVDAHLAARGYRPPPPGKGEGCVDRWWPLDGVGAPGGVIDVPGTRELVADLDAKHAAWVQRVREEDERADRQARALAERRAQAHTSVKSAPVPLPGWGGPPRPTQGTFTLVRRPEPARIEPEPLVAVPDDLAAAFEATDATPELFRDAAEKVAHEIPIEVYAALPRRLHRVAEIMWYRVVKVSPKGHVRYLSLQGVPPGALAAAVGALVAGGVIVLERVVGEYHYSTVQSPYGDSPE